MSNPLNLVTDAEIRQCRLEPVSVFPRQINDRDGTASASFVLPRKAGYLSSDSRIVLPATCVNKAYQYPTNVSVFALVETVTLSTSSSGVIAQIDNAGELYANLNHLVPPEKRCNVDSVIHGINYTFETASSSKLNNNADDMEKLAGMYRLKCDEYKSQEPSQVCKGNFNYRPNMVDGRNTLTLETDANKTPQYSISLNDLFPGFFQGNPFALPIGLVEDEILLDIVFSQNQEWGHNDRAVFCPSLATGTPDAVTNVGVRQMGEGAANQTETDFLLSNPTGGSGTGLRLLCDINNAVVSNLRVLDTGKGYKEDDVLTFSPDGWQDDLVVTPGCNFADWASDTNLMVIAGGADFTQGDDYLVEGVDGSTFYVTALTVNAGALLEVTIKDTTTNNNIVLPFGFGQAQTYKVYKDDGTTDSGAKLVLCKGVASVTTTGAADIDNLQMIYTDNQEKFAIALKEDGAITELMTVIGTPAQGDVYKNGNGDELTIDSFTSESSILSTKLGWDPIWSYDSITSGNKINIDTGRVFIATDIIYDENRYQADMKAMGDKGISRVYTQFRHLQTDLTDQDNVTGYAQVNSMNYNRLIGNSNQVVRSLLFNMYPSGTMNNANKEKFPYHGLVKQNPLLLKYCSRGSLNQNGVRVNVNVNSVPYYSSELQTDMRAYRELNKCYGNMFLPKAAYQAWNQCRQLDDDATQAVLTDAAPSKQPGFTRLQDFKPTRKYELSDVKSGMVADGWNGISQHWLRGMQRPNGICFKYMDGNVGSNGAVVGSMPMDLNIQYDATFNPWYSDQSTLSLYSEVERVFTLRNGQISVANTFQ